MSWFFKVITLLPASSPTPGPVSTSTPVLHTLHWLPIKQRINFKILLLTFKALHHLWPPHYLSDLLIPHRPSRTLRSSSTLTLTIPSSRLKTFGDRAFSRTARPLWNSLPPSVRDFPTLPIFKSGSKPDLFRCSLRPPLHINSCCTCPVSLSADNPHPPSIPIIPGSAVYCCAVFCLFCHPWLSMRLWVPEKRYINKMNYYYYYSSIFE